jgi:hypothetical protein
MVRTSTLIAELADMDIHSKNGNAAHWDLGRSIKAVSTIAPFLLRPGDSDLSSELERVLLPPDASGNGPKPGYPMKVVKSGFHEGADDVRHESVSL